MQSVEATAGTTYGAKTDGMNSMDYMDNGGNDHTDNKNYKEYRDDYLDNKDTG